MYTHIYTDFLHQWYYTVLVVFFFPSHLQGLIDRAQKPNAKCPSWTEVLTTWLFPGLGSGIIRLHHDYSKWPWITQLTFGCVSAALPCCPLLVVQVTSESGTHHPIPAIYHTPSFSCVSQFVFELWFPTKGPTNFLNSPTSHVLLVPMSTLSKIAMWVECPPRLQMNIFSTVYSPSSPNNTYSYAESKCPIFFNQFHKVDPTGIDFWRWWRTRRTSTLPQTKMKNTWGHLPCLSRWYSLALTYSWKLGALHTKRGMGLRAGPTGNLFTILSAPPCTTLDQSPFLVSQSTELE